MGNDPCGLMKIKNPLLEFYKAQRQGENEDD